MTQTVDKHDIPESPEAKQKYFIELLTQMRDLQAEEVKIINDAAQGGRNISEQEPRIREIIEKGQKLKKNRDAREDETTSLGMYSDESIF